MEEPERDYHGRTDAVYHTYPDCPRGRQIPSEWKLPGTGGLVLCPTCRARQAARPPSGAPLGPESGPSSDLGAGRTRRERRRSNVLACPMERPAAAVHEPLKARVLPQRIERRIDPEPAGREIVRHPEQRLELVERQVRLAGEQVDPRELQLIVGPEVGVAADRHQRHAALPLPNRVRLPPQIRQREPEQRMALPVVWRRPALRLEREPGGVGVRPPSDGDRRGAGTARPGQGPSSPGRRRTRSAARRAPAAAARRRAPSTCPGSWRRTDRASRDRSRGPPRG